MKIKLNDKVYIKTGWAKGDWAIVRDIIGREYHVGIAGDTKTLLVFSRRELEKV